MTLGQRHIRRSRQDLSRRHHGGARPASSKSRTGSSSSSSVRRVVARRRRCGWSPASRRSPKGVLRIGDRVVNHVPSRDRDIAMVFQSYALYPHLSVYENIAFGLKVKKMPKDEIARRVQEAARDPRPRAVPRSASRARSRAASASASRWAARSCASRLRSSWTSRCRTSTRSSACRCGPRSAACSTRSASTTIYVTHDQVEAMTMGDRVAVMRKGELQQVAEPQELYDRPLNLFVGGFIGSPAMNMVEATLERSERRPRRVGRRSQRIAIDEETLAARPALSDYAGQDGDPRHPARGPRGRRARRRRAGGQRLHGRVELSEALGSEIMVHFAVDAPPARHRRDGRAGRGRARQGGHEARGRGGAYGVDHVGRFGARSRVQRGRRRSRSPWTRGPCTSSIRRRGSASTGSNSKGAA